METMSITIPTELRDKLKHEKNQSGLIAQLLRKYYDGEEDPEILKLKRDALINKMNSQVKQFDYQIEVKEKELQSEDDAIKERAAREERIRLGVIKRTKQMIKQKNEKH